MSRIAQRLKYIDSSDFREAVKRQTELDDPIDLSIGIPEELTAEHIKAAGIKAIQDDKTVYAPSNGIYELRAELAKKLKNENGINCTPETVTVVPGLTTGQLLVYLTILDPEDEIIVLDPYYPPYPHLASAVGANVIYVSTLPTFLPDIPAIEASITDKTKAIVVNSPNNPTGAVYSEATLRKIAQIAQEHDILVISDEIYEHFIYDGKHFSIGSIYPNTITMNGFSKEYAMTGWRVGYITGPSEIIDAINELQQYAVMSSSSIAQHAALAAIKQKELSHSFVEHYRVKRDHVVKSLKEMGYEVNGCNGSFFAFVKAPGDMTDFEFVQKAAEHNLIVVAGRAFSMLHGFIRISYGADLETIQKGLDVLKKVTEEIN